MTSTALRCAIVTSHASTFGREVRVSLHRRQERLRPGVVDVARPEYRATDTQHRGPVRRDDGLERLFARHDR
jgi:hypothetical protein